MRVRPSPALPFILVLLARSAAAFEPLGNLSPDQALAAFETEPGFAVELVASEPLVVDPVALAFDDRGRLYVAENRDYPVGAPDGSPQGTIALLEDRDHDGRMDTRHDFASGIAFPNGVMCWRGGVVVTAAPEVFWLSDTNGDGRADLRETWLTGFDTNASSQLRANDPTLGPDGWIYFAGGLRGGKIRVPGSSAKVLDTEKGDLKFHPDSRRLELVTGKSQFGLAFDDAGNRFACMNRVQVQHAPIEARYLARNPILPSPGTLQNCPDITENVLLPQYSAGASRYFPISDNVTTADSHTGTYSAACAVHIYRGTLLPAEYQGAAFSCDPTGNLVRGDRLRKAGGTFRAERIHQGSEALRSRDNWFRPVFIADGPDGALYVADMYRKTIEHPEYLPGDLRKQTDFESGKGMGRIWRLRGDPLPRRLSPNLNNTSAAGLVRALDSPVPWVRDTAFRLLVEHGDRRVSRRLRNAIRPQAQTGPTVAKLRLLKLFQPSATDALLLALSHPAPAVRQNAALLAEPHLVQEPELFQALLVRATDPDPHVRHQAALSLGEVNDARVIPALVEVGARQASDRWSRAALLSALSDRTRLESFLHQLPEPTANLENLIPLASDLGRLLALQSPDTTNLALAAATRRLAASPAHRPVLVAFLSGFAETAKSSLSTLLREQPQFAADAFDAARRNASDPAAFPALRLASIRLLALDASPETAQVLQHRMATSEPIEIQSAAARSLLLDARPEIAAEWMAPAAWDRHSPALRQTLIQILTSRAEYGGVLLDALERGAISPGLLTSHQKDALRNSRDSALRSRAETILAPVPGDRRQAYETATQALQLAPVSRHGREVFGNACAPCHRLDQQGVAVGPDLFGIRHQPKSSILYHILIPEAEIAPNFVNYECELTDGRILTGLLAAESPATVTLRMAQGQEEIVPRNRITRLTASRLSLMPQEFETALSLQDLADLLAYLRGEP